jgi:hypothetical protein
VQRASSGFAALRGAESVAESATGNVQRDARRLAASVATPPGRSINVYRERKVNVLKVPSARDEGRAFPIEVHQTPAEQSTVQALFCHDRYGSSVTFRARAWHFHFAPNADIGVPH